MAAKSIHSTACTSDVSKKQLEHSRRANHLSAESVLSPPDGIDDRADSFHVAVFADRCKQICYLEELIRRYAGNLRDHIRGVSRVLLLEQLENGARMLKRKIVGGVWRKHWRRLGAALPGCSWSAGCLMAASDRALPAAIRTRSLACGGGCRLCSRRVRATRG